MLLRVSNKFVPVLILLLFIICCKQEINNDKRCIRNKELVKFEVKRGNLFYNSSLRFNQIQEYYLFKKYNIISVNESGLLSLIEEDSCFNNSIKKGLSDRGIMLEQITLELDSLENIISKTSLKEDSLKIKKFHDGYYLNSGNNGKSYCRVKSPRNNYKEYQDFLIEKILKIDSTFISSSSYLEIDNLGNVINVEIIKRNDRKIDSILRIELSKSKWTPTINASGDTLRVRKYFSL